jgi:hypothetical protein
MKIRDLYYLLKPFIPRNVQINLRRKLIKKQRQKYEDIWPIDNSAKKKPAKWKGWPKNKKFAFVLTHDVDTKIGHNKCEQLISLEKSMDVHSSFNFVPERYTVEPDLRKLLKKNNFEVGVHGLNHDGKLYQSEKIFLFRSEKINKYIADWNVEGFRSPAMHHNLEWIHNLNVSYDASTFDTDPFEPQSDGIGTIFPFWVNNKNNNNGYVELPYTLAQDFTLFILLQEKNIRLWKKKVDWVVKNEGMVLVNTHPDYMCFSGTPKLEEYQVTLYQELLEYVSTRYKDQYWHALPCEVASYCSGIFNG